MLPDFPLASWEVPPDSNIPLVAPADAVFDAIWRGRETQIWVRTVKTSNGSRTFFRDGASEEMGNWLADQWNGLHLPFEQLERLLNELIFDYTYWEPRIQRQFYLDGARYGHPGCQELGVGVGVAEWRLGGKNSRFQISDWSLDEFVNLRAAQVGRMVKNWLSDSNSELHFALDWLHLSDLEKQSRFLQISQTDLAQMKTLMRYVLHTENKCWHETLRWSNWIIRELPIVYPDGEVSSDSLLVGCGDEIDSPRLSRWKRVLWRHFAPTVDEELSMRARCVSQEREYLEGVEVTVETPTNHEILEARAALRDWWTNFGAPIEFARLMDE